jgi:hypothetical protein
VDANAEVGIALVQQQTRVTELTTRAGVLTAAAAIGGRIVAAQVQVKEPPSPVTLVVLGIAVLLGLPTLCGRGIATGVHPVPVVLWGVLPEKNDLLLAGKLIVFLANRRRGRFAERAFYLQLVAVAAATVLVILICMGIHMRRIPSADLIRRARRGVHATSRVALFWGD